MRLFSEAMESIADTYAGLKWVFDEMIAKESKARMPLAFALLLLSIVSQMAIPFTISRVIDSIALGEPEQVTRYWFAIMVGCMLAGMLFKRAYDVIREQIWNRNYLSVNIATMRKLLEQPIETLMSSESDIGAEHVESIKDRAQNIQYMVLFEISPTALTIIGASVLMFFGDVLGATAMLFLTVFNVIWFIICNTEVNKRFQPIDEGFRRSQSMLVERVTFATTVKGSGGENKALEVVEEAIKIPLAKDLKLWASWWQKLEVARESINAIVPSIILGYGIFFAGWSLGTISVMSGWIFLVTQQYSNFGHQMRHLASNIARLKAARLEFEKELPFHHDKGITYKPKGKTDVF